MPAHIAPLGDLVTDEVFALPHPTDGGTPGYYLILDDDDGGHGRSFAHRDIRVVPLEMKDPREGVRTKNLQSYIMPATVRVIRFGRPN